MAVSKERSILAPLVENSATANLGNAGTANHSHGVRVGAKVGADIIASVVGDGVEGRAVGFGVGDADGLEDGDGVGDGDGAGLGDSVDTVTESTVVFAIPEDSSSLRRRECSAADARIHDVRFPFDAERESVNVTWLSTDSDSLMTSESG